MAIVTPGTGILSQMPTGAPAPTPTGTLPGGPFGGFSNPRAQAASTQQLADIPYMGSKTYAKSKYSTPEYRAVQDLAYKAYILQRAFVHESNKPLKKQRPGYFDEIRQKLKDNYAQQDVYRKGIPLPTTGQITQPTGAPKTAGTLAGQPSAQPTNARQAQIAALEQQLAAARQQFDAMKVKLQTDFTAQQQAMQAQQQQSTLTERQRVSGLASPVIGPTGGEVLRSGPLGALFGGRGVEVGPGVAAVQRGQVLGQPGSLLGAVGLRTPSAQAIGRMTPGELSQFRTLGQLTGIPEDEFERELLSAVPGGTRGSGRFDVGINPTPRLF